MINKRKYLIVSCVCHCFEFMIHTFAQMKRKINLLVFGLIIPAEICKPTKTSIEPSACACGRILYNRPWVTADNPLCK